MAARSRAAPFSGPAAPGMAGHVPLSESSRSEAEGPFSRRVRGFAARAPPGWAPAALGPAGFAKGRRPGRRSVSRPRRAWAWRGMIRCRACPEASAEGPLFPAMRPADIGGRTRGIVETVSLRSTHPIISQFGINPFFTDVHVQKFPEGPSFSHVLESPMGFVFRDGFCRARSRLFSETGSGEEPWRSLASNWRPAVGSSD